MIIVTGGSGFIGTNLLCYLKKVTREIILSADIREPPFKLDGVDYAIRDVAEMDGYSSNDPVSTIFHLAAQAGVDCDHKKAVRDNILGTVMVAEFAKQTGAHVVFASSGAVDAVGEVHPLSFDATSGYGISKLAAEQWLQTMVAREGLSASILRFSNVYGWQPEGKSVVHAFIKAAASNSRPMITGSGFQERDFVHVYDVVMAMYAAAQKRYCGLPVSVSTGTHTSMRDLWAAVIREAESEWYSPRFVDGFSGPSRANTSYDAGEMEESLGCKPMIGLRKGLGSVRTYWEDIENGRGPDLIDRVWQAAIDGRWATS